MKKILFATGNKNKVREAQSVLQIELEIADIELDEVQSMDLIYVAKKKAEEAFAILKKPVIIDDVGIFIAALNGFPGPFVKFMEESMGIKKLLDLLKDEKNRDIVVQSVVAFHNGQEVFIFVGEVKGEIAREMRGTDGWGFDPIVIPAGQTQTYAELGFDKKNELSHRKKAFVKFKEFLDSQSK